MSWTQERIDEISAGYDLDDGGYAFEPIEIDGRECLQWDDPDPDYVPWVRDCEGEGSYGFATWDCPVYVFAPFVGTVSWPQVGWTDGDGDRFVLRGSGLLFDSDRECFCQHDTGRNRGSCGRPGCEDGFVESPGGAWALYSLESDKS